MDTLEIILKELKNQGKSQVEFADGIRISKNTITNWKNGASNSYMKMLPQISDYLNVSVDYLIGKSGKKEKHSFDDDNPTDAELIELFKKIPPEKHAQLKDFMKYLSNTNDFETK